MSYEFHAIFSFIRLTIGFLFVFGFIAPFFFSYVKSKGGIERIVFSWVGLGGLLVTFIFILVSLSLYDLISIIFCLLMLPAVLNYVKGKWEGKLTNDIVNSAEHSIVAQHIAVIEKFKKFRLKDLKEKLFRKPSFEIKKPYQLAALTIGVLASAIRIVPVIQNSAPLSRSWYFQLEAVKNLSLQEYFVGIPEPKGIHSIIHFFSTITQVSPEMIIHLQGALVSFFLTIIVYWAIHDLTRGRHRAAALFGTAIFGLFPTLFLPISLEVQSEMISISVAISFALPTLVYFLRNIRTGGEIPIFYVFIGVIATALTNLFVLLMVLLPVMVLSLFTLPPADFFRQWIKKFGWIVLVFLLALMPYLGYCWYYEISIPNYFTNQLFNTNMFTISDETLLPIDALSEVYLYISGFLFVCYLFRDIKWRRGRIGDETIFLVYFMVISYLYTPYFEYRYIWIDPDQLNIYYGVLICIFFGLIIYSIYQCSEWLLEIQEKHQVIAENAIVFLLAVGILVLQSGYDLNRNFPQTKPSGFFNAYYNIINERIPYTYAAVGPSIDNGLAKNRHYFMNYEFFLKEYGTIDSLYQQYMMVPADQRPEMKEVPPASIFLFLEKPPYNSIQQGILYDSEAVMRDMEQWIVSYTRLEGRKLAVYYESNDTIVYEIINRSGESTVTGVLSNIYPKEERSAQKVPE